MWGVSATNTKRGYKLLAMNRLTVCLIFLIWISACTDKIEKRKVVIQFYKNSSSNIITNEETGITYEYLAKIENVYDEPIVVPYIQYHQLPIEQSFDCIVNGDSLIDIGFGTPSGDYPYFGVDTLFPGETQRNFVLVSRFDKKIRRSAYKVFDFRYYFLKDYSKYNIDSKIAMHEFYIVFVDSTGALQIFKPTEGFNPNVNHSHPIPK